MNKVCTKCNIEKTIDEYNKRGKNKNGDIRYHSHCIFCRKQYKKQWSKENKDNISEYQKQWYEKNKEQALIKQKQRNQENKDKIKQYKKQNKDKISEYQKQHYEQNKDKISEYQKQYYQDNKDKLNCDHEIQKDTCYQCSTQRWRFCSTCEMMLLSPNRLKVKVKVCEGCERHTAIEQKMLRLEIQWKNKFISLGYSPSVNDKIIRDNDCIIVNRRRCDYLYLTEPEFPYNVLVECDENNHNIYQVSCEMKVLQEKSDQITANQGFVKPLVVIRFNPNHKDDEYLERELKAAFHEVFNNPTGVDTSDARGVNIYKLIGYSDKRQEKYKNEPAAQTIMELDAFAHQAIEV